MSTTMWARSAAYWHHGIDKDGSDTAEQNCTRYFGFGSDQNIVGFTLDVGVGGLPVYPQHLRIAVWEECLSEWRTCWEESTMPRQEAYRSDWPEGVSARYLRVELLAHHGSNGHHREVAENPNQVMFSALDGFKVIVGEQETVQMVRVPNFQAQSPLKQLTGTSDSESKDVRAGVSLTTRKNDIMLSNGWMSMAFSRRRPVINEWVWDTDEGLNLEKNLLHTHVSHPGDIISGPWLWQLEGTQSGILLGGKFSYNADSVSYMHIEPIPGLKRNYFFRFASDAVWLTIEQIVDRPIRTIESEAWKWVWDFKTAITATLARPIQQGKNGRCAFPAMVHAPGFGQIAIELMAGDPETTFLKVDTWRAHDVGWLGIECGTSVDADGQMILVPGSSTVTLKISPAKLGLVTGHGAGEKGARRAFSTIWGGVYGFRPEYFGMSNNAASLNCHFVQHVYTDMAACTDSSSSTLPMMDLCGYSVGLALSGGMGYGDNREYFIDSDASLLIAAGTYLSNTHDRTWADRHWVAIQETVSRLLAKVSGQGLVVSSLLSGNSGEHNWSSNWWDVISFGHLDAYSNALAYRAFRQGASIARFVGEGSTSEALDQAADRIHTAYFPCFFNPKTGWLGGWRSQDGILHDYAFLFVNGIAIVYGLVPPAYVQPILSALEAKRNAVGYDYFHLGLPGNLIPIPRDDYAESVLGSPLWEDGRDSFEFYENGGATMSQSYYYVRALGLAHMRSAERMSEEILRAFEDGSAFGGIHSGVDWRTWGGLSTGYEGLLADQFYVLLAIAQNMGLADDLCFRWA
ncbi:MAG: hypothetical protein M1499_06640 [Firmicutes bacterium]|nr:hypothetical protein [Bacillota bacterium]